MKNRKRRIKKRYWLPVVTAAAIAIGIALFANRPRDYRPVIASENKQVSPYLTHELLPNLYNKSQLGEPFELVITEEGINDIISRFNQQVNFDNITYSNPQILFVTGRIILMATVDVKGIDLILTIYIAPVLDANELLNLHVTDVSLGAVNITPVAKRFAKNTYATRLAPANPDPNNFLTQAADSLVYDEPFEPVFSIEGRKLRIAKIDIMQHQLTVSLVPLVD